MNDALKEASLATGARLVDFAAHPVGRDPRLWTEDRFHVNAEGHTRIAAALAQALGLPGTDDAWSRPLPDAERRSRWASFADGWRWCRRHLLGRAWAGGVPPEARGPKRPQLEPVRSRPTPTGGPL